MKRYIWRVVDCPCFYVIHQAEPWFFDGNVYTFYKDLAVRLKDREKRDIVETILSADTDSEVWLFGSRVDDSARGGDIDIIVLSQSLTYGDKLKIKKELFSKMGEQRIDLIIEKDTGDPFVRGAVERGIRLA